jgi:exopolysaccharide biosynthesis polyprenyl glycosylphosphotransferase
MQPDALEEARSNGRTQAAGEKAARGLVRETADDHSRNGKMPRDLGNGRAPRDLGNAAVRRNAGQARAPRGWRTRDFLYRILLAGADLVAAAGALVLDAIVLGDDQLNLVALAAIPVVVLVSKAAGLYDRDALLLRKATLDEAPALFRVATLYTFVVWLSEGFFIDGFFGRDQLLALWVLLFGFMFVTRAVARAAARALTSEERCVVIGSRESAEIVQRKLDETAAVKARVVGRIPLAEEPEAAGDIPVLGRVDGMKPLLREHEVDRVVIAAGGDSEPMLAAMRTVKACGVKASVLPRLLEVVGSAVELDELNGATLLAIRRYGLSRSSRALKRAVDLTGAAACLVVLVPLLIGIAVAIKLTSRGPVLFRQLRMGRNDEVFEMFKFRTMVQGADRLKAELVERNEAEGLFKIAEDPRVTRVGRFLRRSSLDELPQLLNVLRGQMSLVGPRPFVLDEDQQIEGWQRRRLLVRPGMTGLWQIFGSARIPFREMVKIDYLYGANWSLWLDVKILLRTVPYVLARRGL